MGFFDDFKGYVVEKEQRLREEAKNKWENVYKSLKNSGVYKKAGALAIAGAISMGALTSCTNPVTVNYTYLDGRQYKVVMYNSEEACLIPVTEKGKETGGQVLNVIVNQDGVIVNGEHKGETINSNNNTNGGTYRVDEGNKVTQVTGNQNRNTTPSTPSAPSNSGSDGGVYRVDEGNNVSRVDGDSQVIGDNTSGGTTGGGSNGGVYRVDEGNNVSQVDDNSYVIGGDTSGGTNDGGIYRVDEGNNVTQVGDNSYVVDGDSNGGSHGGSSDDGTYRVDDGNEVIKVSGSSFDGPSYDDSYKPDDGVIDYVVNDGYDDQVPDYTPGEDDTVKPDPDYDGVYDVTVNEGNEVIVRPEPDAELHYSVGEDNSNGGSENNEKKEVTNYTVNDDNKENSDVISYQVNDGR